MPHFTSKSKKEKLLTFANNVPQREKVVCKMILSLSLFFQ